LVELRRRREFYEAWCYLEWRVMTVERRRLSTEEEERSEDSGGVKRSSVGIFRVNCVGVKH
jgi:hypothetical protein